MGSESARGVFDPDYQSNLGSVWLATHWSDLPRDHWVAAKPSGEIARDRSFDGLLNILRDKNIDPENVAIAFVPNDDV
jgi:hypothetical protein